MLLTRSAAAQLFEPPQGLARELADNNVHLRLPLAPLPNVSLTSAVAVRVEVGKLVVDRLAGGFKATLTNDAVDVAIEPSVVKLPGTYTVVVEVGGTVASAKQKQQIELVLTLPSSKLRPIAPLLLLSERLPFLGEPTKTVLHLETDSSSPGVTAVSVAQPEHTMVGEAPIAPAFGREELKLDPDHATDVTLTSDGIFPIGTAKGVLQIDSPRLSEKVSVPFEVQTKVPTLTIVFWFAIWAVLGMLIRDKLRGRLARGDALLALKPLVARARKQIESHPTLETRSKVAQLLAALETAVSAKQNPDAPREALLDEVVAAETARSSWLSTQVEELSRAAESLLLEWSLPGAPDLATPAAALDAAANAAMADDPNASKQQQANALPSLRALTNGLRGFAQDALQRLSWLEDPGASIPNARVMFNATEGLRKELSEVPAWSPSQPRAVIEQLPRVHRANADLSRVAQRLREDLQKETKLALQALIGQSVDLLAKLTQAASIPAPGGDNAVEQLQVVQDAAKAFALDLASFITDEEAKTKLMGGAYVDAIQQQLAATAAAKSGRDRRPQIAATYDAPTAPLQLPSSGKSTGPDLASSKQYPVSIGTIQTELVGAEREQPLLRLVAGAVAAVLAALLAWLAFRKTWVGTVEDFSTIAALGFFTDFTLDSVILTAQKLKSSS